MDIMVGKAVLSKAEINANSCICGCNDKENKILAEKQVL